MDFSDCIDYCTDKSTVHRLLISVMTEITNAIGGGSERRQHEKKTRLDREDRQGNHPFLPDDFPVGANGYCHNSVSHKVTNVVIADTAMGTKMLSQRKRLNSSHSTYSL